MSVLRNIMEEWRTDYVRPRHQAQMQDTAIKRKDEDAKH